MQDQLQEAIGEFGRKIEGIITRLSSGYLYAVNDNEEKLGSNNKEVFNYVTLKLL